MNGIIVTGATSMLGLALVRECLKRQINVLAVIRKASHRVSLLPVSPFLELYECDLDGIANFAFDLQSQYDALYHFAWEGTQNRFRHMPEIQARNIEYTFNAIKLAKQLNCKKFIGAGSQAEYGRVDGIVSPDLKVAPESAYGIAKYSAGRLGAILSRNLDIEFIWTRVFSVYGKNDMPSTMIMQCIDSLLRGERPRLTKCEQQWDYLHCTDAARVFYLLGEKGKSQTIYNIGSGVARPLSEYVYAIRDAIDSRLEVGIGDLPYAEKQVMHLCADIANLREDTGFAPSVPFDQGIEETVRWRKIILDLH